LTTHVDFWSKLGALISEDMSYDDVIRLIEDTAVLGEKCDVCGVSFGPTREHVLSLLKFSKLKDKVAPWQLIQAVIQNRSLQHPHDLFMHIYIDMTGDETWAEFEAMLRERLGSCEDGKGKQFLNHILTDYVGDLTRPPQATPLMLMHFLADNVIMGPVIQGALIHVATVSSIEEMLAVLKEIIPDDKTE
jgi:hypothetical protein